MISKIMSLWIAIPLSMFGVGTIYFLIKRFKSLKEELFQQEEENRIRNQDLKNQILTLEKTTSIQKKNIEEKIEQIAEKDTKIKENYKKIEEKENKLNKLTKENAKLTAKYQRKVKSSEVKKKNLAKYRIRKKETRTIQKQIDDIVGKGDKWLPHSSSEPKSHQMGKPKGSNGGGRTRPDKIHRTMDLYPTICPQCGADLKNEKTYIVYDRVLTDMIRESDEVDYYRLLKPINIKQNIYRSKCPGCNMWIYPNQGLFKHSRFGPGFICYVISKRIQRSMSYAEIICDLKHMFGEKFTLSVPAIIDWFIKFEDQIFEIYEQLEVLIKEEDYLHIDETGLPMMGKNWWLWVLCTANLVLFKQSSSRGHESISQIIDGFEGTIVADFFRAYEKFDKNPHQKCLAHLLSDIIELIVKLSKENERIAKKIKGHQDYIERKKQESILEETGAKKKRGRKPKDQELTKEEMAKINHQYKKNEKSITQATELGSFFRAPFKETCFNWKRPKKERISYEQAKVTLSDLLESLKKQGINNHILENIVKRCEKFKPQLFTYLKHEKMPPDNNSAERRLRRFALQRRVSGDFKSVNVTKQYVTYLSLYMTCKANARDFDKLLQDIINGQSVDLRMFLI